MRSRRSPPVASLFAAMPPVAAVPCERGGPGDDADKGGVTLGPPGAAGATPAVVDVVWHAWKGKGHSRSSNGYLRPMKSFRSGELAPRSGGDRRRQRAGGRQGHA